MREPLVAIILSNYKGASIKYKGKSILYWCLSTLYKNTRYRNYVTIVADDDSGDGSAELTKRTAPKADFIVNKNCRQFAKNNNRAVEYALKKYKPDYFLLLNYDTIINDPAWLKDIVGVAEQDRKIGAVSPDLVYPDSNNPNGRNQGFGMRFHDRFSLTNLGKPDIAEEDFSKVLDAEVMPGVALLVRSSVVKKVGLLDENYIGGYEDVDYCLRMRSAGMRVVYDGRVEIIHLQGYHTKAHKTQEWHEALQYTERRNQFYFLRKHLNEAGVARFVAWHMIYLGSSFYAGGFRLKDHALESLGIAAKAFVDAQRLKLPSKPYS